MERQKVIATNLVYLRLYGMIPLIFITISHNAFTQQPAVFPKQQWQVVSPESQGVDSYSMQIALDTLKRYCHEDGIDETLIIRYGKVIYQGENVEKVHSVWSCSKAFTTTALSVLILQGKCTLEDIAANYEPLLKEHYPNVTLRQMANMTSGYSASGNDRWDDWESEDWSWRPYKPDTPYSSPGTTFQYWDENMMMLGRVLTQIAGRPIYEVVKEAVTDPIDLGDWYWKLEKDIKGVPIHNGCTDVHMNATQLARMGLLYLNKGVWNGKRVLDEQWVTAATSNQVPEDLALITDVRGFDGRGKYGYGWWVRGDTGDMLDTPEGTAYMSGYNNNLCFIIPAWDMVFVRMGKDGNPEEGKRYAYNAFFRELKKAIR